MHNTHTWRKKILKMFGSLSEHFAVTLSAQRAAPSGNERIEGKPRERRGPLEKLVFNR